MPFIFYNLLVLPFIHTVLKFQVQPSMFDVVVVDKVLWLWCVRTGLVTTSPIWQVNRVWGQKFDANSGSNPRIKFPEFDAKFLVHQIFSRRPVIWVRKKNLLFPVKAAFLSNSRHLWLKWRRRLLLTSFDLIWCTPLRMLLRHKYCELLHYYLLSLSPRSNGSSAHCAVCSLDPSMTAWLHTIHCTFVGISAARTATTIAASLQHSMSTK